MLARIQNELFNLGSDLATLPADRHPKQPVIEARHVTALEHEIDGWNESLPELRSFVLPGGGMSPPTCTWRAPSAAAPSAYRPPARRRADRRTRLPYVNRLSDALFVMSRHAARLYGEPEPLWEPEKT